MMRLTIEREKLVEALAFVGKCAGSSKYIPILGHVLLSAKDSNLTITASDSDKAARASAPASVDGAGAACLPADLLIRMVKSSDGADVSIEVDSQRAKIVIGRSRFSVPILPAEDFPPMPMLDGAGQAEMVLPAGLLERVAKEVSYAKSTEQTRYYLCGVYWASAPGEMHFCATDGKRLSLLKVDAPLGSDRLPGIIVPDFPLPSWSDPVAVVYSNTFLRLTNGAQAVATKLVYGSFPDYGRIIPKNEYCFIMDRADLLAAVKRMALAAEDGEHSVLMIGRNETLTLTASTARAEIVEEVRYSGPDFQTAMTSQNLIATLESMGSENVEMRLTDHRSPVVIAPPKDLNRTAIVMPFRDRRLLEYLPQAEAA